MQDLLASGQWVIYDLKTNVSFSNTPSYVQDNEGGMKRGNKMMTPTEDSKDADEGKGEGSGEDPG